MKKLAALLVAAALPFGWAAVSFADGQEKLMKEAAKELVSLNDDMLKSLNLKPEELAGKRLYVRAHVQTKEDGASVLKVEEISASELKRQLKPSNGSIILQGTLKAQPDRTWKLSIDDAVPQPKPGESENAANGKKDK